MSSLWSIGLTLALTATTTTTSTSTSTASSDEFPFDVPNASGPGKARRVKGTVEVVEAPATMTVRPVVDGVLGTLEMVGNPVRKADCKTFGRDVGEAGRPIGDMKVTGPDLSSLAHAASAQRGFKDALSFGAVASVTRTVQIHYGKDALTLPARRTLAIAELQKRASSMPPQGLNPLGSFLMLPLPLDLFCDLSLGQAEVEIGLSSPPLETKVVIKSVEVPVKVDLERR